MGRADWGKDNGASYWRIEEYPGDRFVLELLERIFCLLWKESKARGNTECKKSEKSFIYVMPDGGIPAEVS